MNKPKTNFKAITFFLSKSEYQIAIEVMAREGLSFYALAKKAFLAYISNYKSDSDSLLG